MNSDSLLPILTRIAQALERLSPPPPRLDNVHASDTFSWNPATGGLTPVCNPDRIRLEVLKNIDSQQQILLENTRHFAQGLPANNAMLWGARGMGKSSLVKAVHQHVNDSAPPGQDTLALIEIQRDDLSTLPALLALLRKSERRFVLFCDDLSFEHEDTDYKALKSVLDGGICGRPPNVILYVTSNRRHLMPRSMIENEQSSAIHPSEAIEEKLSLSDRFGLWIGFHNCTQDEYLEIVRAHAAARGLDMEEDALCRKAVEWALSRGSRSGRVACQFIDHLSAELKAPQD